MNVIRYPMGVLHSCSIKNIFYDKIGLRLFYFLVTIYFFNNYSIIRLCKSSHQQIEKKAIDSGFVPEYSKFPPQNLS